MGVILYSKYGGDSFAQDLASAFIYTDSLYKAYNYHKLTQEQMRMVYEVFWGTEEIRLEIPVGEDGKYNEEAFYSYSHHLFDLWSIQEFFYKSIKVWFRQNRLAVNEAQDELIRYFLLWFFGTQNDVDEIAMFGKYVRSLLSMAELFVDGDMIEGKATTVGVRIDFVKYNAETHLFEPIDESDGIADWTWENSEGGSGECVIQTSEYGSRFVIGELPRKKDATLTIRMTLDSDGMVLGNINQTSSKSYDISIVFDETTGDSLLTIMNKCAFVNIWSVFTFVKFKNLKTLIITKNPEIGEVDQYNVSDYTEETAAGWSKILVDVATEAEVIYHELYEDEDIPLTLPLCVEINNINKTLEEIEDDMESATEIPNETLNEFGITLSHLTANRKKEYDEGPFDYYQKADIHHVPYDSTILYHEDILQLEFRDFDIVPFFFDVLKAFTVIHNHGAYLPSYATKFADYTQYLATSQSEEDYAGWKKVTVDVNTDAIITYDAPTTTVFITNVNDTPDTSVEHIEVEYVDDDDPDDVPLKFGIKTGKLTTNRNTEVECPEGCYISEIDVEKIPCTSTIMYDDTTQTLTFIDFNIHV